MQFEEESDKNSSEDERPKSKRPYCMYHGRCGHTTDKCRVIRDLIKGAKKKKFKKDKKSTMYNKHEVNALAFKANKKKKHQEMN